ncbi:MAG: hypothetical protein E7306_04935 [Butyrivibrio sp.]|nr:hypothetical protein [Butyrivibrio sp.]
MDSFNNIFDIAIVFGGIAILYYAVQMKVNDVIKPGIIIPPDVNDKRMKDREGFKNYAFPRHSVQGILLVILGVVGIFLDLIGRSDIHILTYVVALVVLLLGNMLIEKGKRRFY